MVQAAAGYKVPQVVEGHPPDRLGMISVGGNTALLLKAPQLDTRVARSRRQMTALQHKGMTVKLYRPKLQSVLSADMSAGRNICKMIGF